MIHFDPLSFLLGASVASGVLFVWLVVRDAWRKHVGRHNPIKAKAGQYIDWSKVPEGYDWVAVSGFPLGERVAMYPKGDLLPPKPFDNGGLRGWIRGSTEDHNMAIDCPRNAIIGPLPPWRESLRHRPGK